MTLSKDQIQELYHFTRQHFVEWHDLQTELVDHLANDIENILAEKPQLTFSEAKNRAFKKFGVFGFHDVITEKHKALNKKYWKLVWSFYKHYFKLPKIVLTIGLIGVLYNLFSLPFINKFTLLVLALIYLLIPFGFSIVQQRKLKRHQKETGKKWVFETTTNTLGGTYFLLQIPFQMMINLHRVNSPNFYMRIGFALFFVLSGFFFYIAIKIIPPKIEDIIAKEYPEYNKLQKT
ncbi:MAG: hypothetical protein L3J45_07245 [Flavobacteriaceae bacterium]|nr:hypothetical protein [Flavobacteriaceae bacterium]